MTKLCVIDLNFTWPPDGGAPVDLLPLLRRYAAIYDTTLLLPRLHRFSRCCRRPWPLSRTKFFRRGEVSGLEGEPFRLEPLDFDLGAFHPRRVADVVAGRLAALAPDHVWVADGWYFKPELMRALQAWRPVLRLYAHEMMCLQGNGLRFRHGRVCDIDFLAAGGCSFSTCRACAAAFYAFFPSPRWIFEFLRSGAWRRNYVEKCRAAFNSAALILVGNSSIRRRLQPHLTAAVKAVPHGVDTRHFRPAIEKRAGLPGFLLLGRLEMKNKGVAVALAAAGALWRRRQDFRVLLNGPRALSRRFPFVDLIPWTDPRDLPAVYQRAYAFLVPSLWPDPFPIVTLEAMASGLPVIGSAVGGIPEQIVDGQTGFWVPPGDAGALAERMEWLLDHPREAAKMGEQGRARAVAEFDIDVVFERHYRRLFEA